MMKVVRAPGSDSWFVAEGKGRSFQPISGPYANRDKAERQRTRMISLRRDKRERVQCYA